MKRKIKIHGAKYILYAVLSVVLIGFVVFGIYLYTSTKNDYLWLDLSQLEHKSATTIYHTNENGDYEIYAQLPLSQQKTWVSLEEIPIELQQAFIAVEDKDFYDHMGFSLTRTVFAVFNELSYAITGKYIGGDDGMMQGASTLTQQLVKNLTADNSQSGLEGYMRKIREIYRAILLEIEYDKDTILQAYLNIISFTGDTAGVGAESIELFNKNVSELTLEQCASIACITKNPTGYNPETNPEEHIARRNYVLYQMYLQNYITQQEYENASMMPIGLESAKLQQPQYINSADFTNEIIDVITADLIDNYNFTSDEAHHLINYNGLQIYTSLNLNSENAIEELQYNLEYEIEKKTE